MQKNHKKSIVEIIEEIKNEQKNEGLKLVHIKYTFEDWKGGTFGGMKFDKQPYHNFEPNYYTLAWEGNLYFVEVPQEVATQILSEQKKIYDKTVENLAQNFIDEFDRQHQMRGNGETLLKREIEELEKLFFEENLSIEGSIEVIKYFNFNTVVSFRATSEETKYTDWQIRKIRRIHDKIKKGKRYRNKDEFEWYRRVKPDNNTDLEKYEIRVEALEKYRLHLIGFRDGKLSPSQPFTDTFRNINTNAINLLERPYTLDNKTNVKEMQKKKILSSVFISYNTKDKKIAQQISKYLEDAGVETFFWEKDAPGGKTLKKIMTSNIEAKDRLLFIASENSIKSVPCQFELTQGRQKQDKLWKTILFPIHIDDFLFKVEKDDVKPKNKREDFWENIEELREINSLDFTPFKNGITENTEEHFRKMINKIIDSLEKHS